MTVKERSLSMSLILRAGTPPTKVKGGTSLVTTAPAYTKLPIPTSTPVKIVTLAANKTSSSTTID